MKIYIIYSTFSCSKPVWVPFFCWAQKKIFWRMLKNSQLLVAVDFHSMEKKNHMEVSGYQKLYN